MRDANLAGKSGLCRKITKEYRDSIDPIKNIKFAGKCKDFMYKGEKICDIIWDRFNPLYGKDDPNPSWRPKRWCVFKPQRKNNHSKSTENMYKKGELNRSTNIGAISNERERIKTLKKNIAKKINKDNFSDFLSPKGIYPALNNKKEENRKVNIAKKINKDNFSDFLSPNNKWKYLRNKKTVKNKVEKRKAATNYEVAEL